MLSETFCKARSISIINEAMEHALLFLNDSDYAPLIRVAAFHYMLTHSRDIIQMEEAVRMKKPMPELKERIEQKIIVTKRLTGATLKIEA